MTDKVLDEIPLSSKKQIITAPIVFKAFTRKNAETTEFSEAYLQLSVQDYFIKFCESNISLKELEAQLSKIKGEIKAPTLEVEFKEGAWDICDGNELQQSRVGKYVIIHKIISNNDY